MGPTSANHLYCCTLVPDIRLAVGPIEASSRTTILRITSKKLIPIAVSMVMRWEMFYAKSNEFLAGHHIGAVVTSCSHDEPASKIRRAILTVAERPAVRNIGNRSIPHYDSSARDWIALSPMADQKSAGSLTPSI